MTWTKFSPVFSVALALGLWVAFAAADPGRPARPAGGKPTRAALPEVTAEREAAALAFVRQHHEELATLLEELKTARPREYGRAIQELARTSERLQQLEAREPERYELELRAWKLDSRIRLLAARLTMADNGELVAELRELLAERAEVRLEQQLMERERLTARLERIEAAIAKGRQNREEQVDRALQKLLNDIAETRPKLRNRAGKPAASGKAPLAGSHNGAK